LPAAGTGGGGQTRPLRVRAIVTKGIQNAFTYTKSRFDTMWYFQHSNNPPSTCDQMDTPTQEYFGAIQWDVHAPPPGGPYQIFYKVTGCGTWDDLVVVWS
jgi:hypothetical protein